MNNVRDAKWEKIETVLTQLNGQVEQRSEAKGKKCSMKKRNEET